MAVGVKSRAVKQGEGFAGGREVPVSARSCGYVFLFSSFLKEALFFESLLEQRVVDVWKGAQFLCRKGIGRYLNRSRKGSLALWETPAGGCG